VDVRLRCEGRMPVHGELTRSCDWSAAWVRPVMNAQNAGFQGVPTRHTDGLLSRGVRLEISLACPDYSNAVWGSWNRNLRAGLVEFSLVGME